MTTSLVSIADWLVASADDHGDLRSLCTALVERIRRAGVPVQRLNLGVFALHPVMAGYAVIWDEGMQEAREIPVTREDTRKPLYLASPIRTLVDSGVAEHFNLEDPNADKQYPVLEEFRAEGYTHYLGFPVLNCEDGIAVLTVCTKRAGGFREDEVSALESLFPVLKLLVRVVETRRLARTVLNTYLGERTAERVLAGEILRGQGEGIQAALWLCDLRGFTAMTAEVGSFAVIDVMNQYFDCMAYAVWAEDGEILKFMGDAMLVVFRIGDGRTASDAARRAVAAAEDALDRLKLLSAKRVQSGKRSLRAGVSVHLGTVVYGNIGASNRLDFTVMGEAVNLVARLQGLTRDTREPILFSSQVARQLDRATASVGTYRLKGVEKPVEVFKVAAAEGARETVSD